MTHPFIDPVSSKLYVDPYQLPCKDFVSHDYLTVMRITNKFLCPTCKRPFNPDQAIPAEELKNKINDFIVCNPRFHASETNSRKFYQVMLDRITTASQIKPLPRPITAPSIVAPKMRAHQLEMVRMGEFCGILVIIFLFACFLYRTGRI